MGFFVHLKCKFMLIYFPFFLIQKIFLNVLKKGQIFYHQFMLLHFNMCLANACAVAYQGYSLPAVGVGWATKWSILLQIQLYHLLILFTETLP